jgi:hypothetical protein
LFGVNGGLLGFTIGNPKYLGGPSGLGHSSDILSIRFKHTRILRFFGLFKKYLKILDTKANFQAFVFL